MTIQTLTFNQQTRIAVNILIEDDTRMLAFSLMWVTRIFTLFWYASRLVSSVQVELAQLVKDTGDLMSAINMVASIYLNIANILVRSVAFGIGVRV